MPTRQNLFKYFALGLYACAVLQFIRFYVVSTYFYLNMPRYLSGQERLPFQERILPIFLMYPINHSSFIMRHLVHPKGDIYTPSAATPDSAAFYIISLISFSLASFFVYKLYRKVTTNGLLAFLILPVFMVLSLWTYVVHIDANFSYPYDMPSLAFFAGGLLAIYTRRFLPLLAIMFFGTMNRETTLFLVILYIIDAASRPEAPWIQGDTLHPQRSNFSLAQVPWLRSAALFAIWLTVKLTIHHHFAHNDNSENFVRLPSNFGRLKPRLWPTLLNVCGYALPLVLILRSRIRPLRFANYVYVFPFWFAVMFYTGVILETRIYGELCSFIAITSVLLLEEHVARQTRLSSRLQDEPEVELALDAA